MSSCAYLRPKVEVELCAFLTPAVASRPGCLAPQGKRYLTSLDKTLGETQSRIGHSGEEKYLLPIRFVNDRLPDDLSRPQPGRYVGFHCNIPKVPCNVTQILRAVHRNINFTETTISIRHAQPRHQFHQQSVARVFGQMVTGTIHARTRTRTRTLAYPEKKTSFRAQYIIAPGNIILSVVLYGCETWSLTLREERRQRVFENRVLRRIFWA